VAVHLYCKPDFSGSLATHLAQIKTQKNSSIDQTHLHLMASQRRENE